MNRQLQRNKLTIAFLTCILIPNADVLEWSSAGALDSFSFQTIMSSDILRSMKDRVFLNRDTVDFTTGTNFPGNYPLLPMETWSVIGYLDNMTITIFAEEDSTLEFDIKGVDAPIANALRRVLLSEIPMVAIGE